MLHNHPALTIAIAGDVKPGALDSTPLIPHYRAGKLLPAQTTEARAEPARRADVPGSRIKGLIMPRRRVQNAIAITRPLMLASSRSPTFTSRAAAAS